MIIFTDNAVYNIDTKQVNVGAKDIGAVGDAYEEILANGYAMPGNVSAVG